MAAVNSKKRPVESSSEAEDSSSSEEALRQEPQQTLQPPQQPQNVVDEDDDDDDDEEEESDDPEKADATVTPSSKKPQSSSEAEDSSSSEEALQQEPQPSLNPPQQPQDVDDEDADDDEEEESDDLEKADATVTPSSKKPQSETESESESEDDAVKNKSPELATVLTKRALENAGSSKNNKKAKLTPSSKKPQSESESEEEEDDGESDSPEPATLPTKRALENAESSKNNKKAKVADGKIGGSAVDDSKKSAINRVWSEKDEILFLEELHAFMTKNGRDSITNLNAFHETLKDLDLSLIVTKTRLYEKIRGLRNKFQNNVRREQTVFSKPHEEKLYKISEKIWGGEVDVIEKSGLRKSKRKKAGKKSVEKDICKMEEANDVKKDVGSSFPRLSASLESQASKYFPMMTVDPKEFANNMVLKFGKKKAKELEEDWKEYGLMEAKLYATRVKIMSEQFDVLLDVLKRSNLN